MILEQNFKGSVVDLSKFEYFNALFLCSVFHFRIFSLQNNIVSLNIYEML